jgi:3-methyladenine DNA glycosylase AlkD
MDVLKELKRLADGDYKTFNTRIIPTEQTTLGVRVPLLRKIAKKIAKEHPLDFIQSDKGDIFELILLEGMVLSYMDKSFIELLPYTEKYLDKVDNWAQIDTTVCDYKNIDQEKENVLNVVKRWLFSEKEFVVRAGLVMLLAHFVDSDNLDMIFELSQKVEHKGYYVHMANGWLISSCMAKYPEETLAFFKNNTLDAKTHNKAIQKSRESLRVSKEHKALLLGLKKK